MNLERKLSEDLTIAISTNNLEKTKEEWFNYITHIFYELKDYNQKLFELNYNNYSEFIIQNKKNKHIS